MKRLIFMLFLATFAVSAFANTVLVATENTYYKKRLVKTLTEKLEASGIEVTIINHQRDELGEVNPEDYNAIFITNSGALAKVRPAVFSWLEGIKDNSGNVILHTTQTTVWTPPVQVDSITSASRTSNIDSLTDEIVAKILALPGF